MGIEYYASFSPVPLTRDELIDPLLYMLFDMDARVDEDCDRLDFKDGMFKYTYEDVNCKSFEDAIRTTKEWDGVEIHFGYLSKLCSILIWNDIPKHTTVVFCEPGALFERQIDNQEDRNDFVDMLLKFMNKIMASFCVIEPGSEFRSRTREDILQWLLDVERGQLRDWKMVIVREVCISGEKVPESVKEVCNFQRLKQKNVWILSLMGHVDI